MKTIVESIRERDAVIATSLVESMLNKKVMAVLSEARKQVAAEAFGSDDLDEGKAEDVTPHGKPSTKLVAKPRAKFFVNGETHMNHDFINSNPQKFDSDCKVCGGKNRDSVHAGEDYDPMYPR